MSQENKIYEITQMMSDNQIIRGDVSHAAGMVKAMLSEKYIAPITRAIAAENKKARTSPSREARLLAALKPFVDAGSHETLERAIDMLHMAETFKGLTKNMPAHQRPYAAQRQTHAAHMQDASIHEDGVYDVDQRCVGFKSQSPLAPIFLLMAMRAMNNEQ